MSYWLLAEVELGWSCKNIRVGGIDAEHEAGYGYEECQWYGEGVGWWEVVSTERRSDRSGARLVS